MTLFAPKSLAARPFATLAVATIASFLAVMPFDLAQACKTAPPPPPPAGPHCKTGGGSSVTINKPVTINNDINIYKPVTINKDINISNNVTINKDVTINKSIVINKGGSGSASAEAQAFSSASASSSASAQAVVYYGSYSEENVYYHAGGGDVANIQTAASCEMQEATVVKSIHAVCMAPDGREFPASHMLPETFIDASYEGEIARCIPGSHLKLVIGDVVQSDQGMAGTYEHGAVLLCGDHEAVRHYKDGMLKCEPAVPVKDCTERTNLRKYGTGDMFFSFRSKVCAVPARAATRSELEVTGMTLEGGVGGGH